MSEQKVFKIKKTVPGSKRTVFFEDLAHLERLEEFLFVVRDVHDDVGAASVALGVRYLILAGVGADPMDGGRVGVGFRYDLDLVADHERRVEPESEVADYARAAFIFALVLLNEVERAGKRDAANVFFKLFRRHADAVVGNGEGLRVFVDLDVDAEVLARKVRLTE